MLDKRICRASILSSQEKLPCLTSPTGSLDISVEKPNRQNEIELISQRSSLENLDTKKFFQQKDLKNWKLNQNRRANIFLNTSVGFQRVDDFHGRYLQKIYDQNHECQMVYEEAAKDVVKDFNSIIEPPLKSYALSRIKMKKLRMKVQEKNKSKSINTEF